MVDRRELSDFHRPAFRDWRWLETCWFSFFIPERKMRGHVRAAFRTCLDVVLVTAKVYSRSGSVFDCDFSDSQSYVPLNKTYRYSDFSLISGLWGGLFGLAVLPRLALGSTRGMKVGTSQPGT